MGLPETKQRLAGGERLWNAGWLRRALFLIVLGLIWQGYARCLDNPLLFPALSETLEAGWDATLSGVLPARAWTSCKVRLIGTSLRMLLAALLTITAISTWIDRDILETLTAIFNPPPAIALLLLALIKFELGTGSRLFVLIHSRLRAVTLNTHAGFLGVSQTLRMVGRNYECAAFVPCGWC